MALAVITALVGFGITALRPGLDIEILQAVALHRDATVTSTAEIRRRRRRTPALESAG